ncbi:MAG: hypothetical protein ACK5O8_17650 [Pirellula sp.]
MGRKHPTGMYWTEDPEHEDVIRLELKTRKGRLFANCWEQGPFFEENWGFTPCFELTDSDSTDGRKSYFAAWESDEYSIHCLIVVRGSRMRVQWIGLFPDGLGFKETLRYRKWDPIAAEDPRYDPLRNFQCMWDGSQPGWRLCTCDEPVYFAEFVFAEEGPTDEQISVIADYLAEIGVESDGDVHQELEGMDGYVIYKTFRAEELEELRKFTAAHRISLNAIELPAGELAIVNPDGKDIWSIWLLSATLVMKLNNRMLEEGIPVVQRKFLDQNTP